MKKVTVVMKTTVVLIYINFCQISKEIHKELLEISNNKHLYEA